VTAPVAGDPPAPGPARTGPVAPTFLRDVGIVARFELAESVRSKLIVVMVLLFVGAGTLGAWGYTQVLGKIEENAARVLNAPTARRPGAVVRRLRDSASYRDMLRFFVRDDRKANYFARLPPMVVFFGWSALTFLPWLVLFTSAESVAGDVSTRAIRYSVLRTARLPFALGKAAGQLVLVAGVTVLAALSFFVVGWGSIDGFETAATASGLLSYLPRILLYLLPFLAWAMCASMLTASANLARIVSLGGAVGFAILGAWAEARRQTAGPVAASLWEAALYLTPFAHHEGLSYPPGGALVSDVAVCLALTAVYFSVGFTVLRRRDL
jgi:ABC-type transport system involved in multi-copper enzyme maturation permease subunit